MLNTSRRLDWSTSVAPVLEECMRMMMVGGYSEKYYKDVLRNAVAVYDSKLKGDAEGTVPLNRPRKKAERRKEKRKKKKNWGTKGGQRSHCPEIAEREAIPGLQLKVAEQGGKTVGGQLLRDQTPQRVLPEGGLPGL